MSGDDRPPDVRVVAGGRRSTTEAVQRRTRIIEQTMLGSSVKDIAALLALSERHVRRVLREPTVREQIKTLDDETLRSVARRAATFGPSALTVLATVMATKTEPAGARVSAAGKVLDTLIKVSELADLADRIDRLEERLGGATWRSAP